MLIQAGARSCGSPPFGSGIGNSLCRIKNDAPIGQPIGDLQRFISKERHAAECRLYSIVQELLKPGLSFGRLIAAQLFQHRPDSRAIAGELVIGRVSLRLIGIGKAIHQGPICFSSTEVASSVARPS